VPTRRCGELLEQIRSASGGDRGNAATGGRPPVGETRSGAARDAGLSEHRRKTALRVSAAVRFVPGDEHGARTRRWHSSREANAAVRKPTGAAAKAGHLFTFGEASSRRVKNPARQRTRRERGTNYRGAAKFLRAPVDRRMMRAALSKAEHRTCFHLNVRRAPSHVQPERVKDGAGDSVRLVNRRALGVP